MRLNNLAGVSPLPVFSLAVIYLASPERSVAGHSRLLLGLPGVCQLETAVGRIDEQPRPCRWAAVSGPTGRDPETLKEAVKRHADVSQRQKRRKSSERVPSSLPHLPAAGTSAVPPLWLCTMAAVSIFSPDWIRQHFISRSNR